VKFYLDENFPPGILDTIALIYGDHEFRSWKDEGLESMLDVPLFGTLKDRGFDALVTRDRQQLRKTDERQALRDSELVWIGLRDLKLKGTAKLATTTASLIAGLGHVIDDSRIAPVGYLINNVPHQPSQRIKSFLLN
jgi:hypothetical protein